MRCGSRSAFFPGEFEQRLHCRLPWLKLDDLDGLKRRAERGHGGDRRGSPDDDDPVTCPPRPDAGSHDHVHAARVNERQPPEVEHDNPGVALSALQRALKLRRGHGTKLAGDMHARDLATAVLK